MAPNYRKNEGANAEDEIRRVIGPEEELLWWGRPKKGWSVVRPGFATLPEPVAWSVLPMPLLLIAIIWKAPFLFIALFSLFTIIFLYIPYTSIYLHTIARFTSIYALTNKRLIIIHGRSPRKVIRKDLRHISRIIVLNEPDAFGSILFGSQPKHNRFERPFVIGKGVDFPPFLHIENAEDVFQAIVDTREKRITPDRNAETGEYVHSAGKMSHIGIAGTTVNQPPASVASGNGQSYDAGLNSRYYVRQKLDTNEVLLWSGRPNKGNILFKKEGLQYWTKLLVGLLSSVLGVWLFMYPYITAIAGGTVFLIAGSWTLWLFLRNGLFRGEISYCVTDKRIIIRSGLSSRRVESIDLGSLKGINISENIDGTGTIMFARDNKLLTWSVSFIRDLNTAVSQDLLPLPVTIKEALAYGRRVVNRWEDGSLSRFECIRNVRHVYQTILDAHKRLSKSGGSHNEDKASETI